MNYSEMVREAESIVRESIRRSVQNSAADFSRVKLSAEVLDRIIKADSSAYKEIVNQKLRALAKQHSIGLASDSPLVQLAIQGAVKAGFVGSEAEDVALTCIAQVVTRGKAEGSDQFTQDYARSTILANLVALLKKKGHSLHEIHADPRVIELLKRYRIREATVDSYYQEHQRANKILKNVEKILSGEKKRLPVFEAFDRSRNSTFEGFWATVLKNEARDLQRAIGRERDVLTKALRFDPSDERSIDESRSLAVSHDPTSAHEVLSLARRLKQELDKISPNYEKALTLMRDHNMDLSSHSHAAAFQKHLNIKKPEEFRRFREMFLTDLARVFLKLHVTTLDEAEAILMAA